MKCTALEQKFMGVVNDAIILAGGIGTRMLPASLYMPKEIMPLVDTPLLNHLVWEAAKSGVSRIHLVLSKRKEEFLREFAKGLPIFGDEVRKDLPREALKLGVDGTKLILHVQNNPGGVGDAISVAIDDIEGPFLVLLGDMVLLQDQLSPEYSGVEYASNASRNLVRSHEKTGLPYVGVYPVSAEEVSNYGVVKISNELVEEIIEKPEVGDAPGKYVLCGRYIFPDNTREILKKYTVTDYGEMQSIKILRHFIETTGLGVTKLDDMRMYDSGDPLLWLKSQIDHALRREDLGVQVREWVSKRIQEL